jgi:hypothetical protein
LIDIQKARELFVRGGPVSFGDRILDCRRQLLSAAREFRPWESPSALVQRDRECVRALPRLDAFEVPHAAMDITANGRASHQFPSPLS